MPALTGNLYQMADTNKISNSELIPVIRQREEKPVSDTPIIQDEKTELINPQNQVTQRYTGNNLGDFLWVAQIWRGSDYVFSPSEARAINLLASTSENPGETVGKFIASQAISSRTGYDIGTVYQNLNELSKFYSGKDYAPNDSTFAEKFIASNKLIDSQRLKKQWQEAFLAGDNEKAAQLKEQIDVLDAEIGDVLNGVPQSLLDQIANVVIGNAGYMWNTIQTGAEWAMATTAVLTPLVALAGLNPIAAIGAKGTIGLFSGAAAAIGSFMETSSLSEAETFYEMMNSEGNRNVTSAQIFSKLNGLFVGATEIFLDGVTSRGISKIAGKTIDNFGLNLLVDYVGQNTASKFTKPVLDWVTGALDEAFLNEFPQSVFENLMNAAYKYSAGEEFEIDFAQMMSDGLQAASDGFLVGLVYGGLGVPFEMREFRDTSLSLRREANVTPSREMFFQKTEKLKPESVSQEVYDEAREKIFTAARQQQADYMAQNYAGTVLESQEIAESELFAQVDEEGNPVGTPDGSVNRTPQGRLYAEERVNNGTTTVYFGDRENGSIYGSVEFSQNEDKVKVNSVRVSPGYENIRAEMLQQTFADYGFNKEIEWNPTTPGLQSVKQSLIDSNPDKTGLNFRSSSVKANTQAMADTIQKAMPNLSRPEAIVSASLYSLADRNKNLTSLNAGQIFGDAAADGIELTGNRGAVNLAKGLIYAGQNADVSTFTHELFHAIAAARPVERKSLSSAIREEAQNENSTLASFLEEHREIWGDSFNIEQILNDFRNLSDNWTVSQDENVARLYEAYRSSKASQRKTLPQKIRAVLDRLADFINRVYTDLRDSVKLSENIAREFDRITGIEASGSNSAQSGNGIRYQNEVESEYTRTEKKLRSVASNFDEQGRHLAPNGKLSNLPYHQWVMVRTSSFKRWFGDWEGAANLEWLMNSEPIAILTGEEFKENIIDNVSALYETYGNRVYREGLGYVTLTRHDIQSSVSHGLGRKKAAAFAAIPDVIKEGREFNRRENYKDRGYDSIVIAAPISIAGETYVCEVVLNKRANSNNFYLHEVEVKNKLQFSNQVRNYMDENHPNRNTETGASRLIISKLFTEGKFNTSKVLDENGEPLIVYHGTASEFTVFNRAFLGSSTDANSARIGFFFTDSHRTAEGYGEYASQSEVRQLYKRVRELERQGRWDKANQIEIQVEELALNGGSEGIVMPVFLNIRNPYEVDAYGADFKNVEGLFAGFEKGKHDGVIVYDLNDNIDDDYTANHYVTLESNQIKSIDNTGSFDPDNPDIRFQSAYHGSGADFNHFDLSFLSTGAGDQVFGRGVYVTQSEAIARNYAELAYTEDKRKDDISHYEKLIAGKEAELDQFDKDRADSEKMAQLKEDNRQGIERFYNRRIEEGKPVNELLQAKYKVSTWEEIRQKRLDAIAVYPEAYSDSKRDSIVKEIDRYKTELEKVKQKDPQSRNLYSVTIPDSGYLVWEKKVPVAAAEKIAKALNADEYDRADIMNYFRNSGEEMYSYLERQFSYDAKRVADFLSSIGFTGISYPAGTRVALPDGADPRTRNFVIFNENDVLIDDHIRYQDAKEVVAKHASIVPDKEQWTGQSVMDFFSSYKRDITEMIKEYPKVTLDGVLLLKGLESKDMPFEKELIQAEFLQRILKTNVILLPRYMTFTFNSVYDVDLKKGSIADGLSALADDDKYIEFKLCSENGLARNINNALQLADIVFAVVDDITRPVNSRQIKMSELSADKRVILVNMNSGEVFEIKTDTVTGALTSERIQGLESETDSFVSNYIRQLKEVNKNALIDYDRYKNTEETDIRYQRDPDNPDRFRFSGMFYRKPEDTTDQQAKNADPSTVDEAIDAVDYFSPEDPAAFVEYDGPEFSDDELVELGAIPEEPSVDYRSLTPADQLGYTYEEAVASVNPDIVYEGSESAKDRIFADAVNNEENFNRYMFILGENLNLNSNDKNGYIQGGRKYIDPYTDQNRREKLQAMTRARVANLDVRNVASDINLGNQADERRITAARKEIIDNARIYRDLFADLTGDKNMKPKTLIEGRLNISSSEGETYRSIDELAKIAADASFSEIERKLRNGSLKMKDIDDSMLSRMSVTISRIKREYDNAEKSNAALKEHISTLESETSEARKKQKELNNAVRKTIDELNKNVSSQQRKTINPEYAAMAKELRDIKSRDEFIQDEMPTDGRSARGRKILYRARETGVQKWRAYLLKEYGLSDLRAIHKREKELEALMPDENIAHLRQLASQVSKNVAAAEKQIIDMKKELAGFGISSAKTALASNLDSLGTSIKSQKDAAAQIRNKHIPTEGDIDTLINLNRAITEDYEDKISSIKKNYEKLLNEQKERREKLIHAQGQREALRQIKAEKAKYARTIMEPVNLQTTDWETGGQAIMAIQAMIDPQFRRDWAYALDVNLEGETGGATMTIPEAIEYFNSLDDAGRQAVAQVISPQLLARLTGQRKPLNDWTVQELRQMAREVDDLRRLGRQTLTAKNAFLRNQAKYIVKDILANIEEKGRSERRNIPNSQEFKTHRRNIKAKINQVIYSTRRPQELAQLLDGGYGNFGPAYNLLVDEKRYHQNRATKAINERLDKIVPMVTKDVAAALAKTVNIDFGDGHAATFTMDDLGYIYLSQYEEKNRAAVAFGMLVTQEEKGTGIPKGLDADGNIQKEYISSNVIADDDVLENVGWSRYKKALSVATLSLQEAGLMPLIDAIKDDFAGQGKRLQKMMIDVYNTPISLVEHYLPIKRSDLTGEDMAAEFADSVFNTNNSGIMYNPEKGFTIKRVSIPPRQQKPIRSSLLSIWKQSVQQQEWLIENAAYQKKLHRVFLNSELSNAIGSAYTPDLYQEIEDYINLLANPFRGQRKTAAEMAVKNLRGNLAAAYLGWKASGIVLQALTSPFPFLSDISLPRLVKAYIDLAADHDMLGQIYEKSVMMKNRSMNPIVEELIQRANNAGNKRLENLLYDFQQKGMLGLEIVDKISVAGGWLAQYQQTLDTKLAQGLTTAEAEAAAIKVADDLVLKVQPVGDKTELASMFRTNNEYAKAILQFQTSLNVIWNNITADIQGYARNREFRKIAGTLAGYGIAGILVGAVMTGFDDDDDPVEKARDVGFWMLTQFTDSVPWVGSTVTDVFQKAITGKVDYYGNSSIFPAFDKLASAIEAGVDFNWTKALNYLGQAVGYVTGVPVSGMKQVINSIADGDISKLIGR